MSSRTLAGGLSFVRFVEQVLNVRLSPAQRVLALVAFDRLEPGSLAGADREIARKLFGEIDVIPPEARNVLVALCGRASGKSYLLGALYSLWRALVADLSTLAPGEMASALIVSPDQRLGRQVLRFALGAARSVESISGLIESVTSDAFVLRRPDGHAVAIEVLPATRGGAAVRGRSLVSAVLDECAFFRDAEFVINDGDVFRAVAPRILAGGLVILSSTPWAEAGLLFEEFQRNHGHPVTALAARAPTPLMRPDAKTLAMVEREHARDQENALREFYCSFLSAGSGLFFDRSAIAEAGDDSITLIAEPTTRARVGAGADFGFVNDSSALVVVQNVGKLFHVSSIIEKRPSKGAPLQPSAVVGSFAAECKRFGADSVISDGHYREAIREHLKKHELGFISLPEGQSGKISTYTRVRTLLHEGKVRLPNHPRLLRQLHEVMSKPTPGGGLSITSPRKRDGGHGDIVSAFVAALYRCDVEVRFAEPRERPRIICIDRNSDDDSYRTHISYGPADRAKFFRDQ